MPFKSPLNPEAERYITKILEKEIPYQITIANATFNISNHDTFPPGELTQLFSDHLLENNLIKNKIIVDAGAASFALGIIAAKNGAKEAIGIDISESAIECAQKNTTLNQVGNVARVMQGKGLSPILSEYEHKVDLLLCGAPWDTISQTDFNRIPDSRKNISYAFYDIDDALITDVLSKGPLLCSPNGKIFITASMRIMDRITQLCTIHKMGYRIAEKKDIHQDGNIHYILELLIE